MKFKAFATRLPEKEGNAMPKKRSLKDVAAAPLVKKTAVRIPEVGALQEKAARVPAPRKTPRPKPAKPAVSSGPRPDESAPAVVAKRGLYVSLARMAASILIGFIGGFFFGRFIKII
jgi:hypothetical protein